MYQARPVRNDETRTELKYGRQQTVSKKTRVNWEQNVGRMNYERFPKLRFNYRPKGTLKTKDRWNIDAGKGP